MRTIFSIFFSTIFYVSLFSQNECRNTNSCKDLPYQRNLSFFYMLVTDGVVVSDDIEVGS